MDPANIIGYPDHYVQSTERHPMDYLSAQLTDCGLAKGVIGVEMDNYWFSAAAFMALQTHLPNATLADATALVNWQRAVKSEPELALMRQAGKIVGRMHERIVEKVEPGIRKCDLVADIYDAALRYDPDIGAGGDYPALVPLLPSGTDASAPHLTWDDQPMKSGEGTFFEIAGVIKRYHCPLSRTVFLGKPTQTFLDAEKAVLEGMEAGLEKARVGIVPPTIPDRLSIQWQHHALMHIKRPAIITRQPIHVGRVRYDQQVKAVRLHSSASFGNALVKFST
jgi:ectoine hydrolase